MIVARTLLNRSNSSHNGRPNIIKRPNIENGTLEFLKLSALLLMAADHVNKFLFHGNLPVVFEAGRLVMPIFGTVLAYNLSRPHTELSTYTRTLKRLLLAGLAATPTFIWLVGWWPLNIMFTLSASVFIMFLLERGHKWDRFSAYTFFAISGAFVEFWWPAILTCVLAWLYFRRPSVRRLIYWLLAISSLAIINQNFWALAAVPVIAISPLIILSFPRNQKFFYVFYPAHLLAIYLFIRLH